MRNWRGEGKPRRLRKFKGANYNATGGTGGEERGSPADSENLRVQLTTQRAELGGEGGRGSPDD